MFGDDANMIRAICCEKGYAAGNFVEVVYPP